MAALTNGAGPVLALTLLSAGGLLCAAAQASILDDGRLANVTAASAASTTHMEASLNNGAPGPGSLVVVSGTQVSEQENKVKLGSGAQADANALNLSNASGSDNVNTLNLYLSGASPERETQLDQRNQIAQTTFNLAHGGFLEAQAGASSQLSGESINAASSTYSAGQLETLNQHLFSETTTTRLNTTVNPERIGFFDNPVTIGSPTIELPSFTIGLPSVPVEFAVGDDWGRRFDLDVNIDLNFPNLLTVSGATLFLGEVTLEGSDIVLTGPRLELPDLQFGFCFLQAADACDADDTNATVTLSGPTLKLNDIVLEGANPIGDIGIDLGYAVAGDGSISFDGGVIALSGDIPLDIGSIADVAFDILIPNAGNVGSVTDNIDLPTFDVPVDVTIDFPEPEGFNRPIGTGETCQFSQSQKQCIPTDTTTTTTEYHTHSVSRSAEQKSSHRESFATFQITMEEGELRLQTGQSRLTVLRRSEAEEQRYNLVIVEGQSQRGASVMNGINAAAAIVGNGLNITRITAPRVENSVAGTAIRQHNQFTQIGGL